VQTIPPRGTAFWRLLRSPSLAPVFLGAFDARRVATPFASPN
jgi:hypothetical protein